jgi:uroporphyrin-III C-methyltransferase/precorrin-2 dehydrogenase/sirohydrochlorin ferrochelatase
MAGRVTLLGAGPGDPDLITRRGLRRLAEADLVFYDALVAAELLDEAPKAQKIFVGKRSGNHAVDQRTIETLMVRHARDGKNVVRLKCGDPYVFGRGGEEAIAMRAAGVSFEVVPGVSSCIAAPQVAGIPVTHRGTAQAFVTVTGHDLESFRSVIAGLRADSVTLVVLMGYRNRGKIAASLVELGWSWDTPAALVAGATHDGQQTQRGTLRDLERFEIKNDGAVTLVVGRVVSIADAIAGAVPADDVVAARGSI